MNSRVLLVWGTGVFGGSTGPPAKSVFPAGAPSVQIDVNHLRSDYLSDSLACRRHMPGSHIHDIDLFRAKWHFAFYLVPSIRGRIGNPV